MQKVLTFQDLLHALPDQGEFSKEDTSILLYQDKGGFFSKDDGDLHLAYVCSKALERESAGLGKATLERLDKSQEIVCTACLNSLEFCCADWGVSLNTQSFLYMRRRLLEMLNVEQGRDLESFSEYRQTLLELMPSWTPQSFPELSEYFAEHPEIFLELSGWKDAANNLFRAKAFELAKKFKNFHLDEFSAFCKEEVDRFFMALAKVKSPSLARAGAQIREECVAIEKGSPFYLIQLELDAPKNISIMTLLYPQSAKGLISLPKEAAAYLNIAWPAGVIQQVATNQGFSISKLNELDSLFELNSEEDLPYASLSTMLEAYNLL